MLGCKFLIIGTGETGLHLAKELASLGEDVILVEQDSFGGSYLHNLEIPKFWLKTESKSFQSCLDIFKDYEKTHQTLIDYRSSLKRVIEDKISTTYQFFLEDYQQTPNLRIMPGKGSFFSKNLIEIQNGKDREFVTFEHVILATGKNTLIRPAFLKDRQIKFVHQYDIFQFKIIPSSLLIVGFTPFNLEVADIYSSLGTKIDIVDSRDYCDILPDLDQTSSNYLNKFLGSRQVDCVFGNKSLKINQNESSYQVKFDNFEKEYDLLYVYVEEGYSESGLGLHRVGISYDKTGITTDIRCRTTLTNVWAFGCCNSRTNYYNKNAQMTDFLFKVRRSNDQIKLWDMNGFVREGQNGMSAQNNFVVGLNLSKSIYAIGLSEDRSQAMHKPDVEIEIIQKIDKEGFVKVIYKPSSGQILGAVLLGAMSEYRHYLKIALNGSINAQEAIRYILDDK
jgi:pyruvate/2-oxoglutarate dehydrogenase complex dihydrolipoamide dehydrogenase (E3) component